MQNSQFAALQNGVVVAQVIYVHTRLPIVCVYLACLLSFGQQYRMGGFATLVIYRQVAVVCQLALYDDEAVGGVGQECQIAPAALFQRYIEPPEKVSSLL